MLSAPLIATQALLAAGILTLFTAWLVASRTGTLREAFCTGAAAPQNRRGLLISGAVYVAIFEVLAVALMAHA